ncbi:MAG: winged helix-turn-helix transcriptional regulator [Lachnospiraceae bacterium]|jgi:deoxyribonucleoside regulator|nr:winged helix-turn-helix transcriptional regulator [Lachnospiraceae bacterium]
MRKMRSEVYNQSTCIVSQAAYQYYVEERTRAEISENLGLSSPTISRLLKRAKKEGIIEFKMTEPYLTCYQIQEELQESCGLKSVIVVPITEDETKENEESIKKQVALEGARYLQRMIKDGDTVGLGWGGTMYHLIQYLNPCRKVNAGIVTMHGDIAGCNPKLDAKTLVRRAAMAFGGRNVSIVAPGLYTSVGEVERIKEQKNCQEIFDLFEQIDMSVSGVGSLYPDFDSPLATLNYLNQEEMEVLKKEGVYSDILLRFLKKDGQECDTSLRDRTLAISLETYKKIPCKIVVASGRKKALSVDTILKGGLVDVLVMDYHLAQELMKLRQMNENETA